MLQAAAGTALGLRTPAMQGGVKTTDSLATHASTWVFAVGRVGCSRASYLSPDRDVIAQALLSAPAAVAVYADAEGTEFWTVLDVYTPETREEVFNKEGDLRAGFAKRNPIPRVGFHVLPSEHEELVADQPGLSKVFPRDNTSRGLYLTGTAQCGSSR